MNPTRRALLAHGLPLLAGPLALAACGKTAQHPSARPVPTGAAVLALGDSLTFGTGATPETSYPSVLAGLTGWQITNAGVPGNSAGEALARLPALLQEQPPALVLVSIGGNDLLRHLPAAETEANLRRICELSRAARAQVLLIAIPDPAFWLAAVTGSFSDHPMYARLADELSLPLQRGAWAEVLSNASLRSDTIHANAQGYARFAELLAASAQELGLLGGRA